MSPLQSACKTTNRKTKNKTQLSSFSKSSWKLISLYILSLFISLTTGIPVLCHCNHLKFICTQFLTLHSHHLPALTENSLWPNNTIFYWISSNYEQVFSCLFFPFSHIQGKISKGCITVGLGFLFLPPYLFFHFLKYPRFTHSLFHELKSLAHLSPLACLSNCWKHNW